MSMPGLHIKCCICSDACKLFCFEVVAFHGKNSGSGVIQTTTTKVLQKIVTHLTWQSCGFVAEELLDSASHFARHRFGCRIFCRLIEFHAEQQPTLMLVEEVLQESEDLCCHPFGHHVAQSVLEHGIEQHRDVVAETIDRNPLGYARNQNASYLVERVLSSGSKYQESLLSELSSSLVDLALSRYDW